MRRCHTHTCLGSAPSPARGSLCAGGRCCSLWCSAPWWPGQAQQRAGWLLPALAFRQRVPGAPAPGCKKPCYNRHKLATRASHVITYKSTPCQCSARLNRTAHLTAYVRSSPPLERRLAPPSAGPAQLGCQHPRGHRVWARERMRAGLADRSRTGTSQRARACMHYNTQGNFFFCVLQQAQLCRKLLRDLAQRSASANTFKRFRKTGRALAG